MIIPGFLISIATFPGVIVHEFGHMFFCKIARVAILDVCFFRFGDPVGYVIHEKPRKISQHMLIGIGPFFVNTIIGGLIALPSAIPFFKFHSASPLDYIFIWLGISIAMHSFPSTGDAKSIWQAVTEKGTSFFARIIAIPIVGLIYIGAIGSVFWLDLGYGIAIAMIMPNLLIEMLI